VWSKGFATTGDMLKEHPDLAPWRPPVGITPRLSDAELVTAINETFKGQLDLGRHRGRTPGGVIARVMQRILALTAAIWHNDATGQTVLRSLIAYDHRPLGIDHLVNGY
jgi:hypothetical protein